MNNTGHNGENKGFKVLLLLVVGLTAFSSAMKELNQLQQFSTEAISLAAQLSEKLLPAEVPAVPRTTEIKEMVVKVESCDLKQSVPAVELPWLSNVAPVANPAPKAVVPRPSQAIDVAKNLPKPSDFQFARLKKLPQIDIDPAHFDFTITTDDEPDAAMTAEMRAAHSKAKTRSKVRELRIQMRNREMFLKSLNRSINLRFAS